MDQEGEDELGDVVIVRFESESRELARRPVDEPEERPGARSDSAHWAIKLFTALSAAAAAAAALARFLFG